MISSNVVRDELVGLTWSLWAELGVSGWERRHRTWFIDPEPLILFTTWLGDADARLRDESTDWCIQFGHWISATRLANLRRGFPASDAPAYGELAATIALYTRTRWRGATHARKLEPTHRSRLPALSAPAMLSLRLRGLLGVGARAEVMAILLEDRPKAPSASDLAEHTRFTKRNVALTLDAMRLAGVVAARKEQNTVRYRLHDREGWRRVIGELPSVWPHWYAVFSSLTIIVDALERIERMPERLRKIEASKVFHALAPQLEAAALPPPPVMVETEDTLDEVSTWASSVAVGLATGNAGVFRSWRDVD